MSVDVQVNVTRTSVAWFACVRDVVVAGLAGRVYPDGSLMPCGAVTVHDVLA